MTDTPHKEEWNMQRKFSCKRFAVQAIAGLAATLLLVPALMAAAAQKPAHLTCDSLDHPLGIDSSQPLFSWQLQDADLEHTKALTESR